MEGALRREGLPLALALGAVCLLLAAHLGLSGARLCWSDEFLYASSARELAQGRPPTAACIVPTLVHRFGWPYLEPHARGGVLGTALAFRLLGASEAVALVPALASTLACCAAAFAVLRAVAISPRRSACGSFVLAAWSPLATFACTGFLEPRVALALLGNALALVVRGPLALAIAFFACAIGTTQRETILAAPFALAVGATLRARLDRASLVRTVVPLVAAAGLGCGVALPFARGQIAKDASSVLAWEIANPLLAGEGQQREGFFFLDAATPPPITIELVARRALVILARTFRASPGLEGQQACYVLVHGSVLAAALVAARRGAPAIRSLALFAITNYAIKVAFLLTIYEAPGVGARHLAAESCPAVVAVAAALALRARTRPLVVAAAAVIAASVVADVNAARGRSARIDRNELYSAALTRIAPSPAGTVLVADAAWRVAWERPGVIVCLPPATERTLAWLASATPVDRLVLDVQEPLVAPALVATGRAPRRLAGFELARIDTSTGASLLVYERHTPR